MRKIVCLLIGSLLMSLSLSATNPITEDAALSVVAGSGLKLRTAPNLNSQVVKVIPFGDMVYEIMDTSMTEIVEDRIEWMEGNWIRIEHMGDQGYVFDGFLTSLPIPQFDFELTFEDLDLSSPLESWASYRFDVEGEPTIYDELDQIKMITQYANGHKKIEVESPYMYKLTLELNAVDVAEVYGVLKGMLLTGYERKSFEQNSIFVEDKYGDIERIKIDLDNPVLIKRLAGNQVQVSVTNFMDGGCGL